LTYGTLVNNFQFQKYNPFKIYTLKVGFKDIIDHLETERKKADVVAQEKIKRLKKLGG
jgi:predicted transcriptional regulator